MSNVIAGFSVSLDGFVTDSDGSVDHAFKWYSAGGTDAEVMVSHQAVTMSRQVASYIKDARPVQRRSPKSGTPAQNF